MGSDITQEEIIGGLLDHAENLQKAVDVTLAALATRNRDLGSLVSVLVDVQQQLRNTSEEIGPRAERAGAAAVARALKDELEGASEKISEVTTEAISASVAGLKGKVDEARTAERSLAEQAKLFQWRVLGLIGLAAAGAVCLIGITCWATVEWMEREVSDRRQQRNLLTREIAAMTETAREMEAKGLKIRFMQCRGPKNDLRYCVVGEPGAPTYWVNSVPYFVPQGY